MYRFRILTENLSSEKVKIFFWILTKENFNPTLYYEPVIF